MPSRYPAVAGTAVLVFLALMTLTAAEAAAVDPHSVLEEIDASTLDTASAVRVRSLRIATGLAKLLIRDGWLFPATPVKERPVEFVFLGDGLLELEAPDKIEADQLERFTGSSSLHEPVTEAVMVVCLDGAADALAGRESQDKPDPADAARAQELFDAWKNGTERTIVGARTAMLQDALGDPLYGAYFAGRFESENLGTFLYLVDPGAYEQFALGQFVRPELTEKEQRKSAKGMRRAQRQGRMLGLELDDLGTFDTWLSTSFRGPDGEPMPGGAAFEPEHYVLDVRVDGKRERLDGTAELRLRATGGGRRIALLHMDQDLRTEQVTDGSGADLPFVVERGDTYVILPEAPGGGDEVVLRVSYGGAALVKVSAGKKLFSLSHTIDWYPHAGSIDRATYDLTLHWPKRLDLMASGSLVEKGVEADGVQWCHRRLDAPSIGVSFELGEFELEHIRAGSIAVTIAYDRVSQEVPAETREEVRETIRDVMEYYEEVFGPYPLDYLQVTTSARGFSQGLLGFVTLSLLHLQDYDLLSVLAGVDDRRLVLAHELAHQWWGGVVGWKTYRDQWLSEALANYSALLWARNRLPEDRKPTNTPITDWKSILTYSTENGRTIEQLGPMVLGGRLESSDAEGAYGAIVYRKGAVVLNMLAQNWEEQRFLEGHRRLCEAFRFHTITTEDYFRALGMLFGTDLGWFADEFVYGTGLPEVYYEYSFDKTDDGGWVVRTHLQQQTPYRYTDRIVRLDDGRLDVRTDATREIDTSAFTVVVPVAIGVEGGEGSGGKKKKKPKAKDTRKPDQWMLGRIRLKGTSEEFEIPVRTEPLDFRLDAKEIVFARFFSDTREPKRTTYYRGFDALHEGDLERAESLFREALEAPVSGEEPTSGAERRAREREAEDLDYRIRLNLAHVLCDLDRLDEAAEVVRAAGKSDWSDYMGWRDPSLQALDARLLLLRGDAEAAFKILNRGLRHKGRMPGTQAYLLLAIAAHAVGEAELCDEALETAQERGADVSALSSASDHG